MHDVRAGHFAVLQLLDVLLEVPQAVVESDLDGDGRTDPALPKLVQAGVGELGGGEDCQVEQTAVPRLLRAVAGRGLGPLLVDRLRALAT